MQNRKSALVLAVFVIALLAAAPAAYAIPWPRTTIEKVCYTTAEEVSHFAFVNMNTVGVTEAALNDGVLLVTQMEGDVVEYGYYTAAYGYQVLGWGWIVDDVPYFSANEAGMLSQAQLEGAMVTFSSSLRTNCTEVEIQRNYT